MNRSRRVDEYLSKAPRELQGRLTKVRGAIREAAPEATEGFGYGMPYYSYKGRLAWFGLFKTHVGLYIRPPTIRQHEEELAGYSTTKSCVRFPFDEEPPVALIRMLVRARVRTNVKEAAKGRPRRLESVATKDPAHGRRETAGVAAGQSEI